MKKKFFLIPLLVILIAAGAVFGLMKAKSITIETGYIIKADNGACLYVNDNGGPNRMADMSRSQKMFEKLCTGDKVLIAHDGIEETYPGNTAAYLCVKLKGGDESNIPERIILGLEELGWIGSDEKTTLDEETSAVEFSKNGNSMSLDIPTDWTIEKEKNLINSKDSYSITIKPKDSEGSMTVTCYPTGGFVVCGTGLYTESILDGEGSVGFYDNDPLWSYIVIRKGDAEFVAIQSQLSADEAATARYIVENGFYKVESNDFQELAAENMNVKYTRVRWSDTEGEIAFGKFAAENVYSPMSSKKAVPTVMIKTKKELNEFLKAMDKYFGVLSNESFSTIADECTEEFFEDNILLVSYIWESSGSVTHSVENVWINGDKLEFQIKRNEPEIGTCDMASWFISMEMPKKYAKDITGINSFTN